MFCLMPSVEAAQANKAQIATFTRAHDIPTADVDSHIIILDVIPQQRQVMVKFRRPSCCCTIGVYDKINDQWSLSQTIRAQELQDAQDVILESRVAKVFTCL
jgi:hypothetical protein